MGKRRAQEDRVESGRERPEEGGEGKGAHTYVAYSPLDAETNFVLSSSGTIWYETLPPPLETSIFPSLAVK